MPRNSAKMCVQCSGWDLRDYYFDSECLPQVLFGNLAISIDIKCASSVDVEITERNTEHVT